MGCNSIVWWGTLGFVSALFGCGGTQRVVDSYERVGLGPPISGPQAVGRQPGSGEIQLEGGVTQSQVRKLERGGGDTSPAALIAGTTLRSRAAVGLSRRFEMGFSGEYSHYRWARPTQSDLELANAPPDPAWRVGLQLRFLAILPEPFGLGLMLQSTHSFWRNYERLTRTTDGGPPVVLSEGIVQQRSWQPAIGAFLPMRPLPELHLTIGYLLESYPLLVRETQVSWCFDSSDLQECNPTGIDTKREDLDMPFLSISYDISSLTMTAFAFRTVPNDRASKAVPAGAGLVLGYRFPIPSPD